MAEDKKETKVRAKVGKPPAKKTAPKAAAAQKEAATPKAEAKAAPKKAETKKPAPKKAAAGGQLKVTQTGSPISRQKSQRATLVGLGLNKMHRSRLLADTPETRGMIRKVSHLVKVENVG